MSPSNTRTDRINDPNKGSDTVWCRPRADPRAVLACAYRILSPEQFPFPGNCTLSPSLPFYPCNIRPFRAIYNRQWGPATCTGRAHLVTATVFYALWERASQRRGYTTGRTTVPGSRFMVQGCGNGKAARAGGGRTGDRRQNPESRSQETGEKGSEGGRGGGARQAVRLRSASFRRRQSSGGTRRRDWRRGERWYRGARAGR